MENIEVTDESFKKALEVLGINGTDNPFTNKDDLSKANNNDDYSADNDDDDDKEKVAKDLYEDMKKAYDTKKAKYGLELDEDKKKMEKAFESAGKKNTSSTIETEGLKKAQDNADALFKAIGIDRKTLSKAQTVIEGFVKVTDLVKGIKEDLGDKGIYGKKLAEVEKTAKTGVAELTKALEGDQGVLARLKKVEETPMPQKSTIKSEALEKSINEAEADGKTVLSLKTEITNTLQARSEEEMQKGEPGVWSEGIMSYEANQTLPSNVLKALNEENIFIQP